MIKALRVIATFTTLFSTFTVCAASDWQLLGPYGGNFQSLVEDSVQHLLYGVINSPLSGGLFNKSYTPQIPGTPSPWARINNTSYLTSVATFNGHLYTNSSENGISEGTLGGAWTACSVGIPASGTGASKYANGQLFVYKDQMYYYQRGRTKLYQFNSCASTENWRLVAGLPVAVASDNVEDVAIENNHLYIATQHSDSINDTTNIVSFNGEMSQLITPSLITAYDKYKYPVIGYNPTKETVFLAKRGGSELHVFNQQESKWNVCTAPDFDGASQYIEDAKYFKNSTYILTVNDLYTVTYSNGQCQWKNGFFPHNLGKLDDILTISNAMFVSSKYELYRKYISPITQQGNWVSDNIGAGDVAVTSMAVLGGAVYAGTDDRGVMIYDSTGKYWKPYNKGLDLDTTRGYVSLVEDSDGIVYTLIGDNIYRFSSSSGSEWIKSTLPYVAHQNWLKLYESPQGDLYLTSTHGIYSAPVTPVTSDPQWSLIDNESTIRNLSPGEYGLFASTSTYDKSLHKLVANLYYEHYGDTSWTDITGTLYDKLHTDGDSVGKIASFYDADHHETFLVLSVRHEVYGEPIRYIGTFVKVLNSAGIPQTHWVQLTNNQIKIPEDTRVNFFKQIGSAIVMGTVHHGLYVYHDLFLNYDSKNQGAGWQRYNSMLSTTNITEVFHNSENTYLTSTDGLYELESFSAHH